MRLIALTLAFSSYAGLAACPNLEGKYATCRSTTGAMNGSRDMVVTQETKDGITTYTMTMTYDENEVRDTEVLIADGKLYTHTETDTPMGEVTTTTVSTCANDALEGAQTVAIQGQEIVNLKQVTTKKDAAMESRVSGSVFGQDIEDTLICE